MKEDTIIFSKRSKHDHFTQDNKLKETLQDLISEPESDENTILIHETQQKIETLETKVIYNSLIKKSNFNLLENERQPFNQSLKNNQT